MHASLFVARVAAAGAVLLIGACSMTPKPAPEPLPDPRAILTWSHEQQLVGYKSVEQINPVNVIARGERVHALPKGAAIKPEVTLGGKTMSVEAFMRDQRFTGALVLKDGAIVLERYALGRTAEDRWTTFSVAKSVTSTLMGAAIKDGAIESLNAPVDRYVTELRGTAYEGVTVRQLLTMTSGVAWNEVYTDPNSDVSRAGLVPVEGGYNPMIGYLRTLPRAAPAGTKFNYSTGETDLVGHLVSRATGKTLADYASEKIWRGYGMEADAIWALDGENGHERAGCCISLRLRDYARLGQLVLDDGAGITPDGWFAQATKAQVPFDADGNGYGYFWWISPGGVSAIGIFGQMIHIVPSENLVIVLNGATEIATGPELTAARQAFIQAVLEATR